MNVASKRKADLGDLINLGNVKLHRVKLNKTDKRMNTGLAKVVQYALWERGLASGKPLKSSNTMARRPKVIEGTREAPEFGKPISSKGANFLAKKTRERKEKRERL